MNDDLIRFAAEKVGGKVDKNLCGEPEVAITTVIAIEHGTCPIVSSYALSSPDLFLRGLGVAPDRYDWKIEREGKYLCVHMLDHHTSQTFTEICDDSIPEAFWACWFKLEKGGA